MTFPYPPTRKGTLVETLHGVEVADPYRWLEHADSPETIAWGNAQNALTRAFVDGPARATLLERLTRLYDYRRTGVPVKRGSDYFFTRNTGLQKQSTLCMQQGRCAAPRVLVDPNEMSPDGTVAITAFSPSPDGALVGYALSRNGSDQQEIRIRDVATATDRPDIVRWARFTNIAWLGDGSGFYYTRFPEPGSVPAEDENYHAKIYLHRLGERQESDSLVFERPTDREIVPSVAVSEDGCWVVVTAFKGSSDKCEVFVGRAGRTEPLRPLVTGFTAGWFFIESVAGLLYFQTDDRAPLGRIVALHPDTSAKVDVIGETRDKLNMAIIAGRRLVLSYLHQATDRLRFVGLDGVGETAVEMPLGSIVGLSGHPSDDELVFGFASFTQPPTLYCCDARVASLTPFADTRVVADADAYESVQVWYRSKDGTAVSMFLVHRKGLVLDGNRPVLLSGYGGFNVNMTPGYDPANLAWLEDGGVYALANLRGGGEYGESWHQAGMFERKQNVFDDFIAAAEWLIANNYTSPARLAIEGGSNGGLLVAAVMVQRPELFGAVICRVPVADMLRYHLFTVGRFWASEYGTADDPAQFRYLRAYSPYHNVRDGVTFPPTLILTADSDDRVAPGMAKKFAARLQSATAGPGPVLIRVETRAGHGAGKPITKVIEEDADIFAFLHAALGL